MNLLAGMIMNYYTVMQNIAILNHSKKSPLEVLIVFYIHPLFFLSFACVLMLFLALGQFYLHLGDGFLDFFVDYFSILLGLLVFF